MYLLVGERLDTQESAKAERDTESKEETFYLYYYHRQVIPTTLLLIQETGS